MVTIERDLVVQDGRILGRLERWDCEAFKAKRCHSCNQLVPVPRWEAHQVACHTIGWGRYRSPLANLRPTTKRRGPKVDFVAELAHLLR